MKLTLKNGSIEFHLEEDCYIIDLVKVLETRKGTGTKLINKAEKYISKRKIKRIELYAEPQDESIEKEDLLNFYRSLGYEDNECEGDFSKQL